MTFAVGETVVDPHHGAAGIEDIETRTIKGEEKLYLVLRIVGQNDLVVRVPAYVTAAAGKKMELVFNLERMHLFDRVHFRIEHHYAHLSLVALEHEAGHLPIAYVRADQQPARPGIHDPLQ